MRAQRSSIYLSLAALIAGSCAAPAAMARDEAAGNSRDVIAPDVAADSKRPLENPATRLEYSVIPGAWFPRLEGRTRLGGIPFSNHRALDLNDTEPVAYGEVSLRKAEIWELNVSAFDFETSASGRTNRPLTFGDVSLLRGDRHRSSIDMTSATADLTIGSFRPFAEGERTDEGDLLIDFRVAPKFGFRYVDVDQRVEAIGGPSHSVSGEWLAITAGLAMELQYRPEEVAPLFDLLELDVAVGAGPALGGDGGMVWDVRANFIVHVSQNVGMVVGYRAVELDVEGNDGFEFDGGLQGLFAGVSIRF